MKIKSILKPVLTRNDALFASASGAILFLVFPPFNLTPLLAFALIPLLLRLQPGTTRANAEMGFLSGFVFHLGLLQWLHHVTAGGMLALVVYLSLIWAAAGALIGWAKRYPFWIPLAALIWAIIEYLRSLGPLSFAWGYLGHGLYPIEALKQITYWIGVPGLSFIIFGVNASLLSEVGFWIKQGGQSNQTPLRNQSVFAHLSLAVFLLPFIMSPFYGQSVVKSYSQPPQNSQDYNVALIQGAFEQERKESASSKETLDFYLDLSSRCLQETKETKPDLIVWPESTITVPLEYFAEGVDLLQSFCDEHQVEMLIGAVSGHYSSEGRWQFWNKAFLFSPGRKFDFDKDPVDLSSLPSYSKMHLVPFGEWIPLGSYWPMYYIETMIEEAGAGLFEPGKSMTVFQTQKGTRFAVTICFESTLPALWRQAKNEGIDFIVNLTNDAWYRRSAGLEQHYSQCSFRAAENRIYTVRAANTGISGLIGPTGRALETLPPFEPAYGTFKIPIKR